MIALYGHGYVADYIAKHFDEESVPLVRLHHTESIPDNATFIINSAGVTGKPNVDACESQKDECVDGNILWPLKLEQSTSLPILHISSGCVYTGYEKQWTESDEPNFTFDNASFYSACKGLAQKLLEPYMHKSYLFRIRMPFGPDRHDKNLLTKFEKYQKLVDFENSITHVEDLANCVLHFVRTAPAFGIYNVCNPGSTSTRKICDKMGISKDWMTHTEFRESVKAPRSNCVLDTSKLEKVYAIRSAEDAVNDAVLAYRSIV